MELPLRYKSKFSQNPAAPLVYFVHGRAGSSEVMWTFKRCLPDDVSIISVEADRPDRVGGFSWWDVHGEITNQMLDEGVEKLSSFIDASIKKFELYPRKIAALGFSQGAGALSLVFQRRPALFSSVGLLAGFVIKDWTSSGPTHASLPNIYIAHGTMDDVVPISRAREGAEWLRERGAVVKIVEDDVKHKGGATGMRELKKWLNDELRPSLPGEALP